MKRDAGFRAYFDEESDIAGACVSFAGYNSDRGREYETVDL